MAKRRPKGQQTHKFRNKLLLNQWLVSLFGIDPLAEHEELALLNWVEADRPVLENYLQYV